MKLKLGVDESRIDTANNGLEAFEKVKALTSDIAGCRYGLILMDTEMPVLDGLQSTDKIRKYLYDMNVNQPLIVAVTGNTESNIVLKAFEAGSNQVLSKPC